MSSLRQRLERLERTPRESPHRQPPISPELRRRLDRILGTGTVATGDALAAPPSSAKPHPTGPPDLTRWLDAERVTVGDASALQVVWECPPAHRHGQTTVAEIATSIEGAARELFPEHLTGIDHLHQLAFLDTETTGLAGGAGTIPFQIGVGRWHPDPDRGFRVVQLFLEELHREAALLQLLARELDGVRCLVTYNGAGYDVPLLQNRHVLTRQPWPLGNATHLDLLHPARALWRATHPDCRLGTLEASLLGFGRRGDIPGAEIPPLYRAYLSGRVDPRLAAVFRHNRDDILSLAGLLAAASDAARRPRGAAALGVGLLHSRRGHAAQALPALEAALRADLTPPQRARALRELSLAHKRAGAWQEALALWRELQILDPADPFPVTEAAKALEHRLGDPAAALALVEQALANRRWIPKDRGELERRRRRLLRRAG